MTNTAIITLGNRLNDNGSISEILKKRLELTIEAITIFNPNYIVLSGGVANKKAKISEAEAMKEILIKDGIDENLIILENKSKTTYENAEYSIPIVIEKGVSRIVIVTSIDHYNHDLCQIFSKMIKNHSVELIFYTKNF